MRSILGITIPLPSIFSQGQKVQYPFTIDGFGTFDKQVTGDRTFDINEDGLAHVGLVPDFLAELKNVGVSDADLDPLFNSAEAYIRMWEKAETASDTTPPIITAPASHTVNNDPGQATAVVIFASATATDDSGSVTVTQTTGSASGSAFPLGTTTIDWEAVDPSGNTANTSMTVTVVDTEFPLITVPADITVDGDPGQTTAVVIFASATATDNSGSVTVVDTTAPVITGPANVTEEATGPQTIVVIGSATATDLVGPVAITRNAPATFGLGDTVVTWTATDAYGNFSTGTQMVTVVDTTAPTFDLNQLVSTVWPVNKRRVDAATVANVSDAVDDNPGVVLTVTSNQSISGSDWSVAGNTASVKADRSGKDGDRVYTVTATVTDFSGNSSSQSVEVVVPHDQGENKSGGKKK